MVLLPPQPALVSPVQMRSMQQVVGCTLHPSQALPAAGKQACRLSVLRLSQPAARSGISLTTTTHGPGCRQKALIELELQAIELLAT